MSCSLLNELLPLSIVIECLGMDGDGVAISGKGDLPCKKNIIHMTAPGAGATPEKWTRIVRKCLATAEKAELRSISFPAIGTGKPTKIYFIPQFFTFLHISVNYSVFQVDSSGRLRLSLQEFWPAHFPRLLLLCWMGLHNSQ